MAIVIGIIFACAFCLDLAHEVWTTFTLKDRDPKGYRLIPQRYLILQLIRDAQTHLTAEELLEALHPSRAWDVFSR
jgi:hypothetical protein